MQAPIMVLNANVERETGRAAQLGNIAAAKAIADIIRTTLGPRSMLKMLLDPMGGIVITNDGHCILREIDVSHPAAKSMLELCRAQDEEVGDGATSVIILSGEVLSVAEPFLGHNIHPTTIVRAYNHALQIGLRVCSRLSRTIDPFNIAQVSELVTGTLGTKFASRWSSMMVNLSISSVSNVVVDLPNGKREVDTKRYVRIEKIPGGEIDECRVIQGILLNKDIVHPKMSRRIERPVVLLLDCPLEYRKGESAATMELTKEEDWTNLLRQEEECIEEMCAQIIALRPNIVVTEKGISDLAQHYLVKAGITALRRLRKTDNNRLARACGGNICSQVSEVQDVDLGRNCGLFEVRKIGDEYFAFFEDCTNPKACAVLLRGGSKDVLNEMERNLQDAVQVVRNIFLEPKLLPGGGATEMAIATEIRRIAQNPGDADDDDDNHDVIKGVGKLPFLGIAQSLEVIPKTLAQNCGANVVRVMTELRARSESSPGNWSIDGCSGRVVASSALNIWEPYGVKVQTFKTAIESACMILRIDDVVAGVKKKKA